MRHLPTFFLVLAVAVPGGLGAQVIEGHVVAYETGEPLEGALVFVVDSMDSRLATTLSDSVGAFRVAPPGPGTWWIGAELLGHGTVRSDSLAAGADETVTVEIRMAVEPVQIEDPVVVVAPRSRIAPDLAKFWERVERGERTGFGDFIYGDDLRLGTSYPTDLLRTIPGVRVTPGRRGQIVQMRGGCVPAVFLDGTQLNRFNRHDSLDDYVGVYDIEGIEVYRGPHQPGGRFLDRSGCGTVLVWTKRGEPDPDGKFGWKRLIIGVGLILGLFLIR